MAIATDWIMNGQGTGPLASLLTGQNMFDPGLYRPYFDEHGRAAISLPTGKVVNEGKAKVIRKPFYLGDPRLNGMVVNSPTVLRKDEWLMLDSRLHQVARERLRAWGDLSSASSFGGFDGLAFSSIEHELMSEAGEVFVDMDGLTPGRNDKIFYALESTPLPLTHGDFFIAKRQLHMSRNSGTPISSRMAEQVTRRVAEKTEDMLIFGSDFQYGKSTGYRTAGVPEIFGYLNFPYRLLKSIHNPSGVAWNPGRTVADFLAIIDQLAESNFYGPFMVYHSSDWDRYLDNDYTLAASPGVTTQTLRERLKKIGPIRDIRRLDRLRGSSNPFTLIFVQLDSSVVEAINGMPLTVIQWESMGGWKTNFKVMTIAIPRFFADYEEQTGLLVGTPAN